MSDEKRLDSPTIRNTFLYELINHRVDLDIIAIQYAKRKGLA
tara:strand:+ start:217 stop:342 length:126 start_codon:yes stop_codon:yes gene_type:complete